MRTVNKWVALFCVFLFVNCSGGSGSSSDQEVISPFSDTLSLTVTGASSSTCTITGNGGQTLGEGTPSSISYQVGLEESAIVTCGDLSSVFSLDDETVALSADSTALVNALDGISLDLGSALIISMISDLLTDSVNPNISPRIKSAVKKASGDSNAVVDSLVDFSAALEDLEDASDDSTRKQKIIALLVNSGEPVLIENVGLGQTISTCTDEEAQEFSEDAVAINATTIGLTGCLVYHSLDATTDLNNPEGAPAVNVPDSFRSLATESGVIAELVEAQSDNRTFTVSSLNAYLFDELGYTAYSQDDEGTTTNQTIDSDDLESFFTELLDTEFEEANDFEEFRFHTGYNPSGGWEINAAASLQDLGASCMDSSRDTVCAVSPLKFDFDGTTLTQNALGDYILRMVYDGGFQDYGYAIDVETDLPYRDANYQPVQIIIDADAYSAIDYTNPLYVEALNPMENDDGDSAPYSSAAWRALYPDMSNVDNSYRFATPEVAVRLLTLALNANLDEMSALQAYGLSKLATRGTAAIEMENGTNAILNDHGKTLSQWDDLTTTWLASGTVRKEIEGSGKMTVSTSGGLTIGTATCTVGGVTQSCTVSSTIALSLSTSAFGGGTLFPTTGSVTVTSSSFGTKVFTPIGLLVSSNEKNGSLVGASGLTFTFTGQKFREKFLERKEVKATYGLTALN